MSLTAVQKHLSNRLDIDAVGDHMIAAIVGDAPSQYAKSPSIWNPTFAALDLPATYLAFDVPDGKLEAVVDAARKVDRLAGFNVTVPYKIQIIPFLDELDARARRIQAVNTVVREPDGRLVGYNTDGQGFIDSIVRMPAADGRPLVPDLTGAQVLVLRAGGAARACAHFLVDEVGPSGRIVLVNRHGDAARGLADELNTVRAGVARAVSETAIGEAAAGATLIVNSTVKGQSGSGSSRVARRRASSRIRVWRLPIPRWCRTRSPQRRATCTPRGSPGPRPTSTPTTASPPRSCVRWPGTSRSATSSTRARDDVPGGRLSGHRTVNGKGINVAQAASGFFQRVMQRFLRARGLEMPETYGRVLEAMTRAW